jgi:hypothetical protein
MTIGFAPEPAQDRGRVTLQVIAEKLDVSTATVSLALRDSPVVAEATKLKVQSLARELGYVYNRSAASLRTARTNMIAVGFHDITNPYFAEMLVAVEETAAVLLRFANGALGTATVSDAVPAPWSWELTSGENPTYPQRPEDCYFICGTEASLSLPRLELWRYDGRAAWDEPLLGTREPVAAESPHVRQLRHFCRVIAGTEVPRIDGADATRTLAVVEAIRDAAASGGVVTIA